MKKIWKNMKKTRMRYFFLADFFFKLIIDDRLHVELCLREQSNVIAYCGLDSSERERDCN